MAFTNRYFFPWLDYLYAQVIYSGSTHSTYLQKLQNLQNRALKVVCNVPFLSSAKPLYKKLNILT